MIKQFRKFSHVARGGFILILSLWSALFFNQLSLATENKTSVAYKLAALYTESENPDQAFLKKPVKPMEAVVSEFQWILDSLKNRCLNPESAIADTIVETWNTLKKSEKPLTLLQTARELQNATKNTNLLGTKKVNFRMTSKSWLKNKLKPRK